MIILTVFEFGGVATSIFENNSISLKIATLIIISLFLFPIIIIHMKKPA